MKNNNTLWAIVGVIAIIILVVAFSKSNKELAEVNEDEIGIDVPLGTGGADEETGETAGEETSVPTQTPTFPQTGFSGSE